MKFLQRFKSNKGRCKIDGFTLIEVMFASWITIVLLLALFDGLLTLRRITENNMRHLEADALAWDLIWDVFNQPYDEIKEYPGGGFFSTNDFTEVEYHHLRRLAPNLKNPMYYKEVEKTVDAGGQTGEAVISLNVFWEDEAGRKYSLMNAGTNVPYQVTRGVNSRETSKISEI